ncbi:MULTISPECIES: hypothetical protein [unclassified Bartonella]|uniref:hypothetical protein n=1 Tax=unclassified Bartonella TaxID=2645622 RepID=UPI0035CEF370
MEDVMSFVIGHIINNIPIIVVSLFTLHYYFKASDLQEQIDEQDEIIREKDTIIKNQETLINKHVTSIDGQIASLHKKIERIKPQDIQFNQQFQKTFPMSLIRRS